MRPQDKIVASLTQPRRNGDWGARSPDGRHFIVPAGLLTGEGTLAPRSGVKVVLTVLFRGETADVTGITRSDEQFNQSGRSRALTDQLLEQRVRQTRILVVGRTGVGKSSTINSLIGSHVASVGHFEPTTSELHFYNGRVAGVPILIADTPGFADARSDRSNDEKYIDVITKLTGEIDLLLFITGLDDPRVEKGEHDTIEILARHLSLEIWDRSIVLLTRSDRVARGDFAKVVQGRSAVLRKAFAEVLGEKASTIPFVPISNERTRTPNRKQWMGELWIHMLKRIGEHGFEAFAMVSLARLSKSDDALEASLAERPRRPGKTVSDTPIDREARAAKQPVRAKSLSDAKSESKEVVAPAPVRPPSPRPVRAKSLSDGKSESKEVVAPPPVRAPSPRPANAPSRVAENAPDNRSIVYQAAEAPMELAPVALLEVTPSIVSPVSTAPVAGQPLKVVQTEFVESGVRVVRSDFNVENASAVVVNAEQATVIGQVVQERAPSLFTRIAAAGSLIWKAVRGFFGWA